MEKGLIFFLSALLCTGLIPKCYSQGEKEGHTARQTGQETAILVSPVATVAITKVGSSYQVGIALLQQKCNLSSFTATGMRGSNLLTVPYIRFHTSNAFLGMCPIKMATP